MITETNSQTNLDLLKSLLEEEIGSLKTGEVKTCPCGEAFSKPEAASSKSWGKMKYCPTHRGMSPFSREKDIERILRERSGKLEPNTVILEDEENMDTKHDAKGVYCRENETIKANPVRMHTPVVETVNLGILCDSEFPEDQEGVTWKKCTECGKPFLKGETIDSTWERKLYCNFDCRKKVENRTKTKRRTETRKTRCENFTPAKAKNVADEKWESLSLVLSAFVSDAGILDSIRVAAVKVGVDCYKQAIRDMGVAI